MSDSQYPLQVRNYSISEQQNEQENVVQNDNQGYLLVQNNTNENPIVAVITIQLNDDIFQNLEIRFNDEPRELAKQFCSQTNLDPQMIPILEDNILQYKQIAIQDIQQKERDQPNHLQSQQQSVINNVDSNQNGQVINQIEGLDEQYEIQNQDIQEAQNQDYSPAIKRVDNQPLEKRMSEQNQQPNQLKVQQQNTAIEQNKMQFPPPLLANNVVKHIQQDNFQLNSNIAWVPERKSLSNISENISVYEQQQSSNMYNMQSRGRAESFTNYSVANSQIYDQPQNMLKLMNSFTQNNFNNSFYQQSSSIYLQKSNTIQLQISQNVLMGNDQNMGAIIKSHSHYDHSLFYLKIEFFDQFVKNYFFILEKGQQKKEMVKSRSQSLFNKSHNDCSFLQNSECTFKPTINPISEQIVQQKQKHLQKSSTHERLYEMVNFKKDKKNKSNHFIKRD